MARSLAQEYSAQRVYTPAKDTHRCNQHPTGIFCVVCAAVTSTPLAWVC
ncbi:hypothetical protein [Meiothermus cerbereus]